MSKKDASCIPEGSFGVLSDSNPANWEERLSQLQAFAKPVLMWFFDPRYVGQGRTTLLAHVCIELAMRGEEVHLDDVSRSLILPNGYPKKKYFIALVDLLIKKEYKGHIFRINITNSTLTYVGQHPK